MGKYPNSGILSRNDRKTSDNQPEFTGSAEINDVEYWMNAWVQEKDGRKFFKISFKPKDGQKPASGPSGDIPF
jgi:hypothetical protein